VAEGRQFIFIGGVEGSGTTLLLRLLSSPSGCASLGGNYVKLPDHPEARSLAEAFERTNRRVWNRKLSFQDQEDGYQQWRASMDRILASSAFKDTSHFLFKRSFPFAQPRDQYAPDLWDILGLWPDVRILVIYRDPRAATFSAFRGKFDSDLRRLAIVCSEQLTSLAAQVRAIGPRQVRIISYRQLCEDAPRVLRPVADFCAIPFDQVNTAVQAEPMDAATDTRWARELGAKDTAWLDRFFNDRRRRQWDILMARQ
jgi:hypothetical protein